VVSGAKSPQNVRVAARSRIFSERSQTPAPEDWLPAGLRVESPGAPVTLAVTQEAEAVPADPAAAAELGAEVQRLRRELAEARERAAVAEARAESAESEVAELRERAEAMKRAAARAAADAHPEEGGGGSDGDPV
jgi:hypothetical protein